MRREILRIEVEDDVPAERFDAIDEAPEPVEVGSTAEVRDEVEADRADAVVVEVAKVVVGEGVVDHRDAGVAAVSLDDGVDHRAVVGAVTAGLHEHGTREPETILESLEVVDP